MIFLSMSLMNITKISVLFFLEWFNRILKKIASMLWIEKNSFRVIETDHLNIIKTFLKAAEKIKVDYDQLKCFELNEIKKIEIEIFSWSEKTMISCCIFNNISFLFIQSLFSIASWCLILTISINTVSFLWLSIIKLDRISWVIVLLNIFSS